MLFEYLLVQLVGLDGVQVDVVEYIVDFGGIVELYPFLFLWLSRNMMVILTIPIGEHVVLPVLYHQ